jgi:anaerobic C4-dicarboxylate transporter
MKVIHDSSVRVGWRCFRQFLMKRAFWILGAFTVLYFTSVLPTWSAAADPQMALLPVRIAFALGIITWDIMFVACRQAFSIPAERPSFIASLSFFLIFGIELFWAAGSAHFL